jgi:hypothetical protein
MDQPTTPKPTPASRALAAVQARAKCMEGRAEGHREFAQDAAQLGLPTLEWHADVCMAGIYTRRAKLARRDERRLSAIVGFEAEMERRGAAG